MYCWRGDLSHTIMVSAQPVYLLSRQFLNSAYLSSMSKTWLAITIVTWIYILTKVTIPYFKNPLRRISSPPDETFPIGHMNFHGGRAPTDHVVEKFENTPNDGFFVCWYPLYLTGQVWVTKPDIVLEMLNTHNYDWEKPWLSKRFLKRILGEGLVNVEGNEHKAMRKAVTPAFSGKHIRDLIPIFYGKGVACVEAMAREVKQSSDGVLEVGSHFSRATLDIIGAACIGKDFNTIENNEDELAKLYELITSPAPNEKMLPTLLINLYFPTWLIRRLYGTIYARRIAAQDKLRHQMRILLQEKKRKLNEKTDDQKDIISIIMRSGDYSDDYLVDQLLTFLAAGHDTTSSELTWTIYLLCLNPDIQDRLRKECNTVLSDTDLDNIDGSTFDASKMPYLTAVCSETLRLYPTVPATARVCVKDTMLNGTVIPEGTMGVVPMWAINRDAAVWGPDATKFNPDRWLIGDNCANGGAANPHALITFLHGPRSCIGQFFARSEMKCLLAAMVRRFRFELADPNEKIEPAGLVTIKPKNGLKVKLYDLASEKENS